MRKIWLLMLIGMIFVGIMCLRMPPGKASVKKLSPAKKTERITWVSSRCDSQNSGRGLGQGAKGVLMWTADIGGVCSSPVVGGNGTVYLSSNGRADYLYALDGRTGAVKWRRLIAKSGHNSHGHVESELPMSHISTPALSRSGLVYVGSDSHELQAFSSGTGRPVWTFQADAEILCSPNAGPDNTVYFGSQGGRIYALDGACGKLRWSKRVGGGMLNTPAITNDGCILVGTMLGLLKLRADTGEVVWRASEISAVYTPVIDNNNVLICSPVNVQGKTMWAVSLETGHALWGFDAGFSQSCIAASSDGLIYVGNGSGDHGKLYALNAKDGKVVWVFGKHTDGTSPSVDSGNTVYEIAAPKLLAIDGHTGRVKWRLSLGLGHSVSSAAISNDGSIYVSTGKGKVYAIH